MQKYPMIYRFVIALTATVLFTAAKGCSPGGSSGSSSPFGQEVKAVDNPLSFSMGALTGALDELSTATNLQCGRASGVQCVDSGSGGFVQSLTYNACTENDRLTSGTVSLRGTRADCRPPARTGESMTVAQDLTARADGSDFTLETTSVYRTTGPSAGAGGGATITATVDAGVYAVRIPGIHQEIRNGSAIESDRTLVSTTPLTPLHEYLRSWRARPPHRNGDGHR